jgi:dienelactone hydrolase
MSRSTFLSLGVSALLFATGASASDPLHLTTPRGATVDVLQDRPSGPGPFPAIVLGSGAGYTMKLPILEHVAEALVAQGIAVFRFDWAYHVKDPEHGVPSKDRAPEIEDMNAVLALARKQAWVDGSRIVVGGKSLGSIIAWRVLRATPDLKGALLLTPVCSPPGPAPIAPDTNYPDVSHEGRASAWVLGDRDPVCKDPILYRFLAEAAGPARIAVLEGNHSFEDGPTTDPVVAARAEREIDLASRLAADFVASLLAHNEGSPR